MAQTPSAGCMMAVRASEKACSAAIDAVAAKCGSVVAVAAVNAPESTVLSGDYVAVSLVVAELAARNEARGADASKSKATKVRAMQWGSPRQTLPGIISLTSRRRDPGHNTESEC